MRSRLQGGKINEYFDQIFVINLRQNLQKWDITAHMLSRYGIACQRFEGVNGFDRMATRAWKKYASSGLVHPFEQILERKLIESPGAWGTLLSYKKLLEKAKREGLERILILEDDIMIHRDFSILSSRIVEELPSDWKLLYFGCKPDDWDGVKPFSKHLYHPSIIPHDSYLPVTHGAFAYALHASTFDLALEHIDNMVWPFDSGSLKEINRQFPKHTYAVQPHLFIPDISVSTIREPGDNNIWAEGARAQLHQYECRHPKAITKISSKMMSRHLEVVALLMVPHEAYYLDNCLQHLNVQGIRVCLIYQSDKAPTVELSQQLADQGVFRIEHIPRQENEDSEKLFKYKQELSAKIQADWFIHLNIDEIPEAPRPYINLLEGIQDADRQGYNCIHFDEFIFISLNDKSMCFKGKDYIQEMLHYYFFKPKIKQRPRAWKKTANLLDIQSSRRHSKNILAQKIFPLSFRLRQYILSQQHAIEKNGHLISSQEIGVLEALYFSYQSQLKKLKNPYDWEWDKSDPWSKNTFLSVAEDDDEKTE